MAKNTDKIVSLIRLIATYCLLLLIQQEAMGADNNATEITVIAEYTYHAPSSVTENEARTTALTRAKIKAIEDHFGAVVTQNNAMTVTADGKKSDVKFTSISQSDVAGEWVETIGDPKYDVTYDGGLIVTVRVKGVIRRFMTAECDVTAHIYCNGIGTRFERNDFRDGDDLFMSVSSPIDGYMAVYLSDGDNVFCLLPYPDDDGHGSSIKSGETKILFSYEHPDPKASVKQYHMTTNQEYELNMLYLVFSPNPFDKASDSFTNRLLPRQLSTAQFHKWISSCKRRDRSFQIKEFTISITR